MFLTKIRAWLTEKGIPHRYTEEDGCGSIDFLHRGLSYHIWEFPPGRAGGGKQRTHRRKNGSLQRRL